MEEFFLGVLFAGDKLDIVNHQDINGPEQLLERHCVLVAQGPDELVHEFLGGQIQHPLLRGIGADLPGNGMHQMGFAQTHTAKQEQRVERDIRGLCHPAGGGKGQFIGLANNKGSKCESRIDRRTQIGGGNSLQIDSLVSRLGGDGVQRDVFLGRALTGLPDGNGFDFRIFR